MRDDQSSDWWIIALVAVVCVAIARPLLNLPPTLSGKDPRSPPTELELSDTFGRSAISDDDEDHFREQRQSEYSFLLKRQRHAQPPSTK
jgi:hypothetical protein